MSLGCEFAVVCCKPPWRRTTNSHRSPPLRHEVSAHETVAANFNNSIEFVSLNASAEAWIDIEEECHSLLRYPDPGEEP
eukprot:1136776-Rhodomonas_salina.2